MTKRRADPDRDDDQVLRAYLRHITGYEVTEVKREYKVNDQGQRELVKEVESTKCVPGDIRAAEFWLTNRQPERWKPARLLGGESPAEEGETGVVELGAVDPPPAETDDG